jgi:hypothetical protein
MALSIFRHACGLGLEGIVSKRIGSGYVSGRTRAWLKAKNPNSSGGDCRAAHDPLVREKAPDGACTQHLGPCE